MGVEILNIILAAERQLEHNEFCRFKKAIDVFIEGKDSSIVGADSLKDAIPV